MKRPHALLLMVSLAMVTQACFGASRTGLSPLVTELLGRMSLEEKVGQMTQISLELVCKGYPLTREPLEIDPESLRRALLEYHVGSILNVGSSAHTVQRWQELITTIQDVATKETRLGIPVLYGIDAVHGAGYTLGATLFPQHVGMAATWNPDLVHKEGQVTAYEVRACGIPWNFSPVLDIGRQPLWPRLWETFGEDPYLASVMARAYVRGLQGEDNCVNGADRVAACAKHYLGYSFPLTGKDRTPAWIPERMLREYFLPPFQAAVEAGVKTVMVNSSEINGIPIHASPYHLRDLLRGELGFSGVIVSDWADIKNLHERERVAASPKEAVRLAVMAGVDMSMVPLDYSFYDLLLELVREGAVPESRIDEAVGRILQLKEELGLFQDPYPPVENAKRFACAAHRQSALQAAWESITLLKNSGNLLPLSPGVKILVTGPTAHKRSSLNGGWTITWQGDREELYPKDTPTILEAIQAAAGREIVSFAPGVEVNREVDIKAAVAAARKADVVIACLGEDPYCETPGNISELTLPEPQLRLVAALAETKVPVVLVLVEGRPRIITSIADKAKAILMAYLPGAQGGQAVADILFGKVNPSGKLPITYPRACNDLTLYDHKYSENANSFNRYNPLFPFGFGLSYTSFAYRDLVLDKDRMRRGDSLSVSVTIQNTGKRAGKEVVQLYLSDLYASVTPSVRRLKRFAKVELGPGEERTVRFTLREADLSFIGPDNRPVVEPGEFAVRVGDLEKVFVFE
ncbi:MAG: glycoside hydrolase family 3 C-terminal domain-containing protein [candidate division KSB1 bacterium]|nr:glycoside hydrolase family 3 C-terminal domain-containing protein [candidate division KSB1 bacterium]